MTTILTFLKQWTAIEGLALLDLPRAQTPEVPVIVMTAWSTIELAADAMRRGGKANRASA